MRHLTIISLFAASLFSQVVHAADSETTDKNVSQIGGTLVPVGDQHVYKYNYKENTIDVNPIGPLFGQWSIAYSRALSDQWAIRLDAMYLNAWGELYEIRSRVDVSLSGKLFFRKMNEGYFIEPGVRFLGFTGETTLGPQILAGKQWTWDSNYFVAAAIGVSRQFELTGSKKDFDGFQPNAYFRIGKAF